MRCLTIAETLVQRGHAVELMGSLSGVDWLVDAISASGLRVLPCTPHTLDSRRIMEGRYDWVIVDSYRIPADEITALNGRVRVLAVVDGDDRAIVADAYLDQNLGSETREWPDRVRARLLAGSQYALVRSAVREMRRTVARTFDGRPPRILAFMGGSDPLGATVGVAKSLAISVPDFEITIVAPERLIAEVGSALTPVTRGRVIGPTPDLPRHFAHADIVVSAAGTSAWDICTLGLPSVLVGVVDNQIDSLRMAESAGVALTLDCSPTGRSRLEDVGPLVAKLAADATLRMRITEQCAILFDGRGSERVAEALEAPYLSV